MRRLWCIAAALAAGGSACEVVAGIRDLRFVPPDGLAPPGDAQTTPESGLGEGSPAPAPDSDDTDAVQTLADSTPSMDSDAVAEFTDSSGTQHDASAQDASFDSGPSDARPEGPACAGDLSNIGVGDFRISFTLTTLQLGIVAVVNQRSACGHGMFWDIRLFSGALKIETDDGAQYTQFTTAGSLVNDGLPHNVLVRRKVQLLTVQIDGLTAAMGASPASFARLSPAVSGMDPCQSGPLSDGTVAFKGTLTDLCISAP
jgi:Laminin G domain